MNIKYTLELLKADVLDELEKIERIEKESSSVEKTGKEVSFYGRGAIIGNYIFGLPDDTIETMDETLDMAMDLNCEFANFYSAMAYSGSKLYNIAIKANLKLPKEWHGYA